MNKSLECCFLIFEEEFEVDRKYETVMLLSHISFSNCHTITENNLIHLYCYGKDKTLKLDTQRNSNNEKGKNFKEGCNVFILYSGVV